MKISILNSKIETVKNVNDRLRVIMLAEKSKLQLLFHEMNSEKNRSRLLYLLQNQALTEASGCSAM